MIKTYVFRNLILTWLNSFFSFDAIKVTEIKDPPDRTTLQTRRTERKLDDPIGPTQHPLFAIDLWKPVKVMKTGVATTRSNMVKWGANDKKHTTSMGVQWSSYKRTSVLIFISWTRQNAPRTISSTGKYKRHRYDKILTENDC